MSRSALDLNESSETASEGSATNDGEGAAEIEIVAVEEKVVLPIKSKKQRRRIFLHRFGVCMLIVVGEEEEWEWLLDWE